MQLAAQGMETERDFYFSKLRQIEVVCQEVQENVLTQQILDIMYATEVSVQQISAPPYCNEPCPQDGFVQPVDEPPLDDDQGAIVTDDQNYGYEEYEDEQEEY